MTDDMAALKATIAEAQRLVQLHESFHNGDLRNKKGDNWYFSAEGLPFGRGLAYEMAAQLPHLLKAYVALEAARDHWQQRALAAEAARETLVEMVLEAENECTAWGSIVENIGDQLSEPLSEDGLDLARSLVNADPKDVIDDLINDGEVAERRLWIMARANTRASSEQEAT